MQTTLSETSAIQGLVSHGMTKELSKEIMKVMKNFRPSKEAGKSTSAKAPHGPEYATKVDLLKVEIALKDEISSVRAELGKEISSVRAELKGDISKLEVSLNKEISSSQNTTIKWIVSLFFAQMIASTGAIIGAIKYFIH